MSHQPTNSLRLRYIVIILFVFSTAFTRYGSLAVNDLEQSRGGTFSMISNEGQNVLNMNIDRDFTFKEVSARAGVNIVFPENKRPPGLSLIEIKYVQYDNGLWGMRFGQLSQESYGYGLVMDGYNSSPASTYFNMSRAGFKGYSKSFFPLGIYGMYAGTGVVGARLTYDLLKVPGLETPVVAGVTYVADCDGILNSNGTLINKGAYGYSADVGFKLVKPWMDAYMEYGTLSNRSNALTIGTKIDGGNVFDFRVEYRILGENFMPNIFNASYEMAPMDITSAFPATNGYFLGAAVRLMPLGIVSVGYEKYSNREPLLRGAVAFNEIKGMSGVVSYEQTLLPAVPYKITGVFIYPLNAITSLVTYYEQIGKNEASYTLAYKLRF